MQSPVRVAAAPQWEVSQSTVLLGAVLGGFVVYLLINGKLLTYWQLITGRKATTGSAAATPTTPPATQAPVTALTPQSSTLGTLAGVSSDVLSAVQLFGLGGG